MEDDFTIQELFLYAEDPLNFCAGQPTIPASSFERLAEEAADYLAVKKTKEEIIIIFMEQSKRFVACGGNHAERFGILRKNPKTGWNYLIDLIQ